MKHLLTKYTVRNLEELAKHQERELDDIIEETVTFYRDDPDFLLSLRQEVQAVVTANQWLFDELEKR
jgi:hypothetical protein